MRTITIVFFLLFLSCTKNSPIPLFSSLPSSTTGITFKNTLAESDVFNVLNYGYFYNGGGVAIGDINNDGLSDVYFTANMKNAHLYLNKGNFQFEEIAEKAGVQAGGLWNTGVTMADVNNDGWLDIYVCRSAANLAVRRKNLLFINNRNNTFSEMAAQYGLDDTGYSTQAAFFDYDKDGDLDMYLLNHSVQEFAGFGKLLKTYKERYHPDYSHKLYQNNLIPADKESFGRFMDVSHQAGIKGNVLGFGLGVAIDDLNQDGWPDIYVSNDYNEEDYCYINQRDGTFKESIRQYFDHTSLFSMGSDVTDINNDGLPEVFTLDMLPEGNFRQKMTSGSDNFDKMQALFDAGFHYQYMRNMLHLNQGTSGFSEIGQLAGVSNTDWSWAALFADFDNDGWKDLFVANGYKSDYTNMDFMSFAADQQLKTQQTGRETALSDLLSRIPSIELPNYIFKNNGDLTFSNKTQDWGFDEPCLSNGAAYGDLDNDGDLDLVINNVNAPASVYRNNHEGNYLKIQLTNCPLNRQGIGATVVMTAAKGIQRQSLMPTRGFQSSVEPLIHFGLGENNTILQLEVHWPNGMTQILKDIDIRPNQQLQIAYDSTKIIPQKKVLTPANRWVVHSDPEKILNYTHVENTYNDFKKEPLLPNMLSTQGPKMSVGDVNADGLDDIYIGGAKGTAGQLFLQSAKAGFREINQPAFVADQQCEDMESLFLDADGDKDLDLYVCSGGNEAPEGSTDYQDRLYINNGLGLFSKSANLPIMPVATHCVSSGDMDRDGDLDLFVGGRLSPGNYPAAVSSFILQNNGKGFFTDASTALAPDLTNIGMVTDAHWSDLNNDNQLDIIMVGDWMPVTFLLQKNGVFQLTSLAHSSGWWNTLEPADLDLDGDTDFVIGNLGLNSQIKASAAEPASILINDFDQNGRPDPILCYYIQGKNYPAFPLDDLLTQLPSLKRKYVKYADYADQQITDIFSASELSASRQLQAQTFASVALINKGSGDFELKPLPMQAQVAPVFVVLPFQPVDTEPPLILLAGNLAETRVKFGRYDAMKGCFFQYGMDGTFRVFPPDLTGLNLRGNIRDAAIVKMADGRQLLMVVRNKAPLQTFEINTPIF